MILIISSIASMLLCLCKPTNDTEVTRHAVDGVRTVAELGRRCGAGQGCGNCHNKLAQALHNAHALQPQVQDEQGRDTIAL